MEDVLSNGEFEIDIIDYIASVQDEYSGLPLEELIKYLYIKYGKDYCDHIVNIVIKELYSNHYSSYDKIEQEYIRVYPMYSIRDILSVAFLLYANLYDADNKKWIDINSYREINGMLNYIIEFNLSSTKLNPLNDYEKIEDISLHLLQEDNAFLDICLKFLCKRDNQIGYYSAGLNNSLFIRVNEDKQMTKFGFIDNGIGPIEYNTNIYE